MRDIEREPEISSADWNEFVFSHPMGNIFQTTYLYDVYKGTKKYNPIKIAIVDAKHQEIQGVMAGVIIQELDGFLGGLSARSIVQGGPLVRVTSGREILKDLVAKYDSVAKQLAVYSEIRNMFDQKDVLSCVNSYTHVDHLNFIINLNQAESDLWGQIHKSRRKNINRAENAGLFVEEVVTLSKLPIFYELLNETYKNVKVPLADISLFKSAFLQLVPEGYAKFFLARLGNEYIGARAVLLFKDAIYDWYAGAATNSLSYYPNEFLVWHILKWGLNNKYSIFDFGGAGEPEKPYGPREFKRRFGGQLVNYGREINPYSKMKLRIVEIGFKAYQKVIL